MYRVVKQGRIALAHYVKDVLDGQIPKAINTSKFARYIAKQTGYELEVFNTPHLEALRGILLTKPNKHALILISDNENNSLCWQRFTLVKEICHLFLEHEKSVASDNALEMAQALMQYVIAIPNFLPPLQGNADESIGSGLNIAFKEEILLTLQEKEELSSDELNFEDFLARISPHGAEETSAVVAAIEIMISPKNRTWLEADIENGCSLYQLANKLKVPRLILEHRLNEWGLDIPIN